MVEPIGVSLAVVGLAVQAADTMLRIRRMFVGIKEAPKLIRRIHQELFDMESVFRDISLAGKHFPDASEAGFERLMESYFEHVDPIADMLIRVQVKREDSSARRAWKAFVTNDNRPVFEELLCNLERTKTNIITYLAGLNIQIAGEVKNDLAAHIAVVEPSLNRIEMGLAAISTTSENIYTKTIQIESSVARSSVEIMRHMDQAAQQISNNIPQLIEKGLQKYLEGVTGELLRTKEPPRHRYYAQALGAKDTAPRNDHEKGIHEIKKRDASHSSLKKRTFCKSFPLPIGFLQTKSVRCPIGDGSELLHIEFSLIPFRWLSSTGQYMSMDRVSTQTNHPSWNLTLRSYNIVPDDAMILKACRNRDLPTIQTLFKYGEASPYDVDRTGRILMSHVWNRELVVECEVEAVREARQVLQFLIGQGVDPTPYVREVLVANLEYETDIRWIDLGFGIDSSNETVIKEMEGILRLCLEQSRTDPFEDASVLLNLWRNTIGGGSSTPLPSSFLFQEHMAGFDELVFEHPDRVFHDVLRAPISYRDVFDKEWQQWLDENYEMLCLLCRGGQDSIKMKVFSKEFANSASRLDERSSCYCRTNSTHLLFRALENNSLNRYNATRARVKMLQKHARLVLIELLRSGEDPEARCTCKTSWQLPDGYRTVTDLAASEGLLGAWESALEACGYDATRIVDEWRYDGVSNMFDPSREDGATLMAPLKLVGSAIHATLSCIV